MPNPNETQHAPLSKEEINACQRRASAPGSCVFVAASAGSGKTKVLTDRVLTLLLKSKRPDRLLCLTFTKAAAAQMANRITQTLGQWAVMPSDDLKEALYNLTGTPATDTLLATARALFALVLETPGGMKIMTIHSFCQSVLKRFPLEAGLAPQFEVMDDVASQSLLETALKETLSTDAGEEMKLLSDYLNADGLIETLKTVLKNKAALTHFSTREDCEKTLNKYYNLTMYPTEKDIISEFFNPEEWPAPAQQYLTKSQTALLKKYIDDPNAHRAFETVEKLKNRTTVRLTAALLTAAFRVKKTYTRLKAKQALLDYDDLILYTRRLLEQSDMASWVLFKLDGGLDHILVDEAQDTNKDQWMIIKLLAEEFFAGEGLPGQTERTIFAVGDKKQSIFSFQGADPAEFEAMRLFFEHRVTQAGRLFETVPLNVSFRSTSAVLNLVNRLLAYAPAKKGVLDPSETALHIPFRANDGGLVEIWPSESAAPGDESEAWKPPVERQKNPAAAQRLAQKIAQKIKKMLDTKEILSSEGRPVQPGDFMILVQRRRQLTNELVRALKELHIPVAGLDRLILTTHIAVQDLLALMNFILQPYDDLTLACLLKSPLMNLTEEDLWKAAYNRDPLSLLDRVKKLFPETGRILEALRQKRNLTPFELTAYVLGPMGGRKAFMARLGEESGEALDEFLNLCLSYEQFEAPSLQGFIGWIGERDIEIKRDLDQNALNAVRIMTVHGSKGLQANIVFLPDTRFVPCKTASFILDGPIPLWFAQADLKTTRDDPLFERMTQDALCEYHRLLYVALTRARDRLYIMAYDNKTKPKNGNWYDLIQEATADIPPDTDGIKRIICAQKNPVVPSSDTRIPEEIPEDIPEWIEQPAPQESVPSRPLTPSKPDDEPAFESALTPDQAYAMRRGSFIHKLLQYLPDIPPEKRKSAALRLKPDDIDIPESIFDLLERDALKELFSQNSKAEVPIVGVVGAQVVSGQIDRLVVRPHDVLIIDFKTNRFPPQTQADVPAVYKKQMTLYKQLLKKIFPDKIIKSYLLWTENLTIMELSDDL